MTSPIPPRPAGGVEIESQAAFFNVTGRIAVFVGIGIVLLIVVLAGGAGAVGLAVIVLVLAAVGAAFFWQTIAAAFGWQPARLTVPEMPLVLGSRPRVVYRRRPRKVKDIPTSTVRCRVVCEERVTYQRGTDRKTDTDRVFDQTFVGHAEGTPEGLEATIEIVIPESVGAPTFDLGDNEVRWYIEATIEGKGLPGDEQEFPVRVGAVLDPSFRNALGDR